MPHFRGVESAMYGYRDPEVEHAAAAEDRAAYVVEAKQAWRARRELELIAMLETRPLTACVTAYYSTERNPPISVELVSWAACAADGDRTLAEAIYSQTARYRLHRRFADIFAEIECDALPESAWEA